MPGLIDRAISAVSPAWAARREASRALLSVMHGSRFREAWASRLGATFPRQTAVTGQLLRDRIELAAMRDRSRGVDDNNPVGKGMLNRIVDNVVGEGMQLQAKTADKAFNAEAEERFADWLDVADVRGMLSGPELQRQVHRAHERDGDVGIALIDRAGKSRLQLISADQIMTPDGGTESPTMNSGVEMDAFGRPLRFNILSSPEFGVRSFKAVPASYFVYYPRMKRFDAVRGEPCFTSTFTLLDQLDGYVDAVAVAARMAAIFGLIFKEGTSAAQAAAFSDIRNARGDMQKAVTYENGMVKFVGTADSVVQVQAQQPMNQTPEFIAALMRMIGLPLDMPLELVLLDFSRVNYSSARAAFLQFYQSMRPKQDNFRRVVMSRIYRWWISRAVRDGEFTTPAPQFYWPHNFMPRGWQWVDPLKDGQAALLEISAGINCPQDVMARLGRDYDEVMAKLAAHYSAVRLMAQGDGGVTIPQVLSTLTRDPSQPPPPGHNPSLTGSANEDGRES